MCLFSLQSLADTRLAQTTRFDILAEEVQKGTELASTLQGEAVGRFLENRVIPSLPTEIASALPDQKIQIRFRRGLEADGLFLAPPNGTNGTQDSATLRIEIRAELLANRDLSPLIAHEFFHALHFRLHPDEEPWVREGLAQTFEYLILHEFNGANVAAAFAYPTTPLQGNYSTSKIVPAQYGHDLFYFYYLWSQCGGEPLFWNIVHGQPERFGAEGITAALNSMNSPKPQCQDFSASAESFEIARIQNESGSNNEDPERYHLWSTTLPQGQPLDSINKTTLKELQPLSPLVLRVSVSVKLGAFKSIKTYWLHRRFPYEVQAFSPNKSDDSWWQVLLKL
ncbi:hypothetical protein WDW37_04530 [Bdellovibrionota bacterium FG-1]